MLDSKVIAKSIIDPDDKLLSINGLNPPRSVFIGSMHPGATGTHPCNGPDKGWWSDVGHLHYTNATQGGGTGSVFPTTILAYRSAIYPQVMTSEYGLGGRLANLVICLTVKTIM